MSPGKAAVLRVGGVVWSRRGERITIIGETKASWIISAGKFEWEQVKLKKAVLRDLGRDKNDWPQYFVHEQDALDTAFADEHKYRISRAVESVRDGKVIRQIAALIGYAPPEDKISKS